MGIEPTLEAWEAAVLPLNYTRSDAAGPQAGEAAHYSAQRRRMHARRAGGRAASVGADMGGLDDLAPAVQFFLGVGAQLLRIHVTRLGALLGGFLAEGIGGHDFPDFARQFLDNGGRVPGRAYMANHDETMRSAAGFGGGSSACRGWPRRRMNAAQRRRKHIILRKIRQAQA